MRSCASESTHAQVRDILLQHPLFLSPTVGVDPLVFLQLPDVLRRLRENHALLLFIRGQNSSDGRDPVVDDRSSLALDLFLRRGQDPLYRLDTALTWTSFFNLAASAGTVSLAVRFRFRLLSILMPLDPAEW